MLPNNFLLNTFFFFTGQ